MTNTDKAAIDFFDSRAKSLR